MVNAELLAKLKVITEEERKILQNGAAVDRNIYMDNENGIVSSRKLLPDGRQIAIRPHTRFVHFPEHTHDYVEIIYMCSGSTTHIIDGDKIILRTGELLFLCQSSKQEILPAGEDDIAVNFIICPEFFDRVLTMIGEEDTPLRRFLIESLKGDRADGAGYLHFEVSDVLPVQNLLENLIWTLIYDTPNKRSINQITMGLLFLELMGRADKLATGSRDEQVVMAVLAYVEEHYKSGSLSELAAKTHYDISTLSRAIKNKTGRNYMDLIQEKRLSQACFLLKNTPMNVEEIAEMIGYKNVSFFHRLFKSHYQVSPKQYRKS